MEFIFGLLMGSLITTVIILIVMGSHDSNDYKGFEETK